MLIIMLKFEEFEHKLSWQVPIAENAIWDINHV
jgi:hypothetical protein